VEPLLDGRRLDDPGHLVDDGRPRPQWRIPVLSLRRRHRPYRDTTAPIDGSGLVFSVNTNPDLDVGFNLWSNNDGSFTGFIAGNSPAAGQPIIYLGETGAVASAAVPEASTWVMMFVGFGGLGFAAFRRSSRSSVPALA
jgi:hypothetical protein